MSRLKTTQRKQAALIALIISISIIAVIAGCSNSDSPTDPTSLTQNEMMTQVDPGSSNIAVGPRTHVSIDPQIQFWHNRIMGMFNKLSDPATAQDGIDELMAFDPNVYPGIVGAAIPMVPPEYGSLLQQSIDAYWGQFGKSTIQNSRGSESGGFDWCQVIKIKGNVTVKKGSTITIGLWGLPDPEFTIGPIVTPVDTSIGSCPDCQLKAKTTAPLSFDVTIPIAVPGYGPVSSISASLKVNVSLVITIEHYQCDPPAVPTVSSTR